jgi:hypothetical protein
MKKCERESVNGNEMVELYSASILENAKTAKGKKVEEVKEELPIEEVPTEELPIEELPKEKKPKSDKQIAAAQRKLESRQAKKDANEAIERLKKETEEEEQRKEIAEAVKDAKKLAAKEKRRLKREEQKPQLAETSTSEATEEDHPTGKRKNRNEEEPPAWLEKLITHIRAEKSILAHDKKPKKQIKIEAEEHAQQAWSEPVTRARVRQHQDDSLAKMYNMMFSNRRF